MRIDLVTGTGYSGSDASVIRVLAIVGIPIACLLHGYVGFLFGAVKADPWWSTALTPVNLLVSAVASGIAVLMVLYLVITWCGTFPVSPHSWAGDIPSRDNLAMHI